MANRWGKSGNSDRFYFLGLRNQCGLVTATIKLKHLLPGRKAMTNLDSVLKSTDITLLTKVHTVKAMVFPVVMYGCESWTIRKAECRRILICRTGVLEKTLESLLDSREIKPVNPKGNQP